MTGISEAALFRGYGVDYGHGTTTTVDRSDDFCPCGECYCRQPRSERPDGLCDDCMREMVE